MHSTVSDRLAGIHPKPVAATLEADRKALAEDWRRRVGRSIERALELAHLTPKEVSHAMGYEDQSALSRWIGGVERPHFDKLFAIDGFYDAWVIACAEGNPRVEGEYTFRVRLRVG